MLKGKVASSTDVLRIMKHGNLGISMTVEMRGILFLNTKKEFRENMHYSTSSISNYNGCNTQVELKGHPGTTSIPVPPAWTR